MQTDFRMQLKIKLLPDKNYEDNISNLTSIKDLKVKFIKGLGDKGTDLKADSLRFFCMGKELQDDLFVYSYDLSDDITIQCMVRRKA